MTSIQNSQTFANLPTWDQPKQEVEVVYGGGNPLTDFIRNFLCLDAKFLYANLNVGSGNVSIETVTKAVNFLEENNLQEVAIKVDSYAPFWYADRVFTNPKTSTFSKIVFGPLVCLGEFLGAGKLFSSDRYDVLSDSIQINSDDPDLALFEAARASYFNRFTHPVFQDLSPSLTSLISPHLGVLVRLNMNYGAAKSAIKHSEQTQTAQENRRTYQTIAPRAYTESVVQLGALTLMPSAAAKLHQLVNEALVTGSTDQQALNEVIFDISLKKIGITVLTNVFHYIMAASKYPFPDQNS